MKTLFGQYPADSALGVIAIQEGASLIHYLSVVKVMKRAYKKHVPFLI